MRAEPTKSSRQRDGRYLTPALLLLCAALGSGSRADDYAECFPKLEAPFQSWKELFSLRDQLICQVGSAYAELWSDRVTQLLFEHWDALPELASLAPEHSERRE